MRYFVISEAQEPIAVVFHDYQRGSYVCRSKLDSFSTVFESLSEKQGVRYVREDQGLRASEYSVHEAEWIDDLLNQVLACNSEWAIDSEGKSSGSDLTMDDLVEKFLSD